MMRAIATRMARSDAAAVVAVTETEEPRARDGWTRVEVKATSLNRHDLWSIKGVGTTEADFPLALGSDVAGITEDGREVIVHSLVADPSAPGGELLDPHRKMLAEATTGGAAESILVPVRNLVDKPVTMTFEQAAALPTAWLTAYRMLFGAGGARPGDTVLVQGAGGGVASAAIALAAAAGLRVWVTTREAERARSAAAIGAAATFEPGERLPERVDVVLDTVGSATVQHSLRSVAPGGTVVVSGATTGGEVTVDVSRIFLSHIRIQGSSLGTVDDLRQLVAFCEARNLRPIIDSIHPLDQAARAVARLESGDAFGKVVVTP
ncbi:zinc-binding dehydrogenase [Nocardia sp. NPDC050799]|uniref:zinc-binding dehydrogenase n=1 Tax=Nocardia sp. NPDC050799 TaxID=3154842 RepID=UPI003405B194